MALKLSTDKTGEVELTSGRYVRWRDVSRHPNKKAVKAWAQKITGTHDKYGVDGDWLSKTTIDGDVHLDLDGVTPGDIIKVSGGSHNNKKHCYYQIESLGDEVALTRLSESNVIELMDPDDELELIKSDVMAAVQASDDVETLKSIRDQLTNRE